MNIDNSLINPHSFLTETHPLEAKEVKIGVSASETQPILPGLLTTIFNSLGIKSLSDAISAPELKAPTNSKTDLKPMADEIEYTKGLLRCMPAYWLYLLKSMKLPANLPACTQPLLKSWQKAVAIK